MNNNNFETFWNAIDKNSIDYLDENFNSIAIKLLEFLMHSILNDGQVDIGTFRDGDFEGAIVEYDIYTSDKNLKLKLHKDESFELELFLFDWDDKEKIYKYKLDDNEIKSIPEGLRNLMYLVLSDMKSRTFKLGELMDK